MYRSSLMRCFSIFKFIFVEHIIKRKSLKNTIGRIKIRERTSLRSREISTQTSTDEMFTGVTPRIYERTSTCSRNVSTQSSNNETFAGVTSRSSQCSSDSMSDSGSANRPMKNERTSSCSRNISTQTSDNEMSTGVTPQFSQCSSDSMSDSDSSNRRVKKITRGISHSSTIKQNKV
jgi:hypothetical protein